MNENLSKLNDKISSLIRAYNVLKEENENLRNQLIASQGQNENLNSKTKDLEEKTMSKDAEIDSMIEKLNFLA